MTARRAGPIVFALAPVVARADLAPLCEHVRTACGREPPADIVCDLGNLERSDAVAVEALARMHLVARRALRHVRFRDAPAELAELVRLFGLDGVLRVEMRRQPEQREQLVGVEEERELDDPAV